MPNGDSVSTIPYADAGSSSGAPPPNIMQALMALVQKNQAAGGPQKQQTTTQPQRQPQASSIPVAPLENPSAPIQFGKPTQGGFGADRGILGLISHVESAAHQKKVLQAETLAMQVNDFLTSGAPGDREKAQMLMDDPKNLKILKTAYEYQPVQQKQEPPPPEAIGLARAKQKMAAKQGGQRPQQQPQGRTVLPSQNPNAGLMAMLPIFQKLAELGKTQQETATSGAAASKDVAEADKAKSDVAKNQADAAKALAEESKAKADADKVKDETAQVAGKSKAEIDELNARAKASRALADRNEAEAAKLRTEAKGGGTPQLLSQFRTA